MRKIIQAVVGKAMILWLVKRGDREAQHQESALCGMNLYMTYGLADVVYIWQF